MVISTFEFGQDGFSISTEHTAPVEKDHGGDERYLLLGRRRW